MKSPLLNNICTSTNPKTAEGLTIEKIAKIRELIAKIKPENRLFIMDEQVVNSFKHTLLEENKYSVQILHGGFRCGNLFIHISKYIADPYQIYEICDQRMKEDMIYFMRHGKSNLSRYVNEKWPIPLPQTS